MTPQALFVKYLIIGKELCQEADLQRKATYMVPIIEIRKENSTEKVSIPARYQLSGAGETSASWCRLFVHTQHLILKKDIIQHPKFTTREQKYTRTGGFQLKQNKQ
jgi:hypothetical protein